MKVNNFSQTWLGWFYLLHYLFAEDKAPAGIEIKMIKIAAEKYFQTFFIYLQRPVISVRIVYTLESLIWRREKLLSSTVQQVAIKLKKSAEFNVNV